MPITIDEAKLLDLLEECLPVLRSAVGGLCSDDIVGKVELVLRLAGRRSPPK
jgi:hypothetical protein